MPTPSAATPRPRRCSRKSGSRRTTRPRSRRMPFGPFRRSAKPSPIAPPAKARSSRPRHLVDGRAVLNTGCPACRGGQAGRVRGHGNPRGTGARRRGATRSSLPRFHEELAPHRGRAKRRRAPWRSAPQAARKEGGPEATRTCSKTGCAAPATWIPSARRERWRARSQPGHCGETGCAAPG